MVRPARNKSPPSGRRPTAPPPRRPSRRCIAANNSPSTCAHSRSSCCQSPRCLSRRSSNQSRRMYPQQQQQQQEPQQQCAPVPVSRRNSGMSCSRSYGTASHRTDGEMSVVSVTPQRRARGAPRSNRRRGKKVTNNQAKLPALRKRIGCRTEHSKVPFVNFFRAYKRKHVEMSLVEISNRVAQLWNNMSDKQKVKYQLVPVACTANQASQGRRQRRQQRPVRRRRSKRPRREPQMNEPSPDRDNEMEYSDATVPSSRSRSS